MKEEVERIKKIFDYKYDGHPCDCESCKRMCYRCPCIGTPKDIKAIMDEGFADRLEDIVWRNGVFFGEEKEINLIRPAEVIDGIYDKCVFLDDDDHCILHDMDLKPTEGVLADHSEVPFHESINRYIAHEWDNPENKELVEEIYRIFYNK